MGPMSLEEMMKTDFYRKQTKMDHRMHGWGKNLLAQMFSLSAVGELLHYIQSFQATHVYISQSNSSTFSQILIS